MQRTSSGYAASVIVTAIVVAIIFFFIGYYSHSPTTTPGTTTITFYESLAPAEQAYFTNVLIPEFEAQYPNISVQFVNLPSGQPPSTIATLVQANKVGASIVGLDNLAVGEDLFPGYLMNLSSIVSNMMPSTLISSAANMVSYEKQVFNGVYFIPFRSNIPLVFYNKTAFTNAGITTPPATDTQLLTDAQTIYTKTGVKAVMFQGAANTGGHSGASTGTELYQWMVQDGGNPFVFNDTGDIQAFEFLYNLSAYFTPGYTGGYWGSYKGLATGVYDYLDYQWPYVYGILTNGTYNMNNNNLGVYGGPSGTSNDNHLLGGDVLVIPKGATDIPALETFAKFLLSPTAQKQTLVQLSWVAINSQAYQNLPSNTSVVGAALNQSISGGVFLRDPTPWISQWNVYASDAFTQIIVDHASYSQIPSILSSYNAQMYSYIASNYNSSVANKYEAGYYKPISI